MRLAGMSTPQADGASTEVKGHQSHPAISLPVTRHHIVEAPHD